MGNKQTRNFFVKRVMTWRTPMVLQNMKTDTSFTNVSLASRTNELDKGNAHEEPSLEFAESCMLEIYSNYTFQFGLQASLNHNITSVVSSIFEALSMDDHILFIANKFCQQSYCQDQQFKRVFTSQSEQNPHQYQYNSTKYSLENRITVHIMLYLRLHKFILTTFEDGRDEKGYEILNLLSLGHSVMNVTADMFKIEAMMFVKNLIHFSLVTDTQLPILIFYMVKVTDYICSSMVKHTGHNSSARENYRELKKWKVIMGNLLRSLSKPLANFEKQKAELASRQDMCSAEEEGERWRLTRLLKRGYRFKKRRASIVRTASKTPTGTDTMDQLDQ